MRKNVAGLSCHYPDEGEGPPVLLIHGFTSEAPTWRHVLPLLATRFRVIAVDLPGFGLSDKPAGFDYSLRGFARWILAYMDALGIPGAKLHVFEGCGHFAHEEKAEAWSQIVTDFLGTHAAAFEDGER